MFPEEWGLMSRRWATKKTAGIGVKNFGGERVIPGNIIVRQRGIHFHPGNYAGKGKDDTLFALKEGCVKFERKKLIGRKGERGWVHLEPMDVHVLHPVYADASLLELKTSA